MMYMALTNFFSVGGGEGGKGGGKGMGGLIISRFHPLYFFPSSSSTQKTENVCNFKVFQSDFETLPIETNLDLYLTRSLRINRLALTPIIDQDKFFNIKQCEEDM